MEVIPMQHKFYKKQSNEIASSTSIKREKEIPLRSRQDSASGFKGNSRLVSHQKHFSDQRDCKYYFKRWFLGKKEGNINKTAGILVTEYRVTKMSFKHAKNNFAGQGKIKTELS